jgi:radical SAM superfamily enzyme YgiQ (UPF0313 family)
MRILLVSTYDLGRQPFGLASPAAWLRQAGFDVECVDLSRATVADHVFASAPLVAFYLPMHTATRLALPVIARVRRIHPEAVVCAYGLYAPLNEPLLRSHGVDVILGGEFEADLVGVARGVGARGARGAHGAHGAHGAQGAQSAEGAQDASGAAVVIGSSEDRTALQAAPLQRLSFIQPDRSDLPALDRYATLQMPDGSRRVAGATEATRGCKHRCRHCPIVPVYDGQFRVVPVDVVLADIAAQVEQGARHITFGDPDFLNGPVHARRLVERLHATFPSLTYDVTIKIEHLLKHDDLLPVLVGTGCLFVTSAVESVDDEVLARLDKGHTRADFVEAVARCRESGLMLAPTFVAFTPWTSLEGYRDLLDTVASLDLVDHVAPVQWGIRLLVTWGSRLLELEDIRARIGPFDPRTLTFPWAHADARVDALQTNVMSLIGVQLTRPRRELFDEIRRMAAGDDEPGADVIFAPPRVWPSRTSIPYLNEPWYC